MIKTPDDIHIRTIHFQDNFRCEFKCEDTAGVTRVCFATLHLEHIKSSKPRLGKMLCNIKEGMTKLSSIGQCQTTQVGIDECRQI